MTVIRVVSFFGAASLAAVFVMSGAFVPSRVAAQEVVRCSCQTPTLGTCDGNFASDRFIVCSDLNAHPDLDACVPVIPGAPAAAFQCPGTGDVDAWLNPPTEASPADTPSERGSITNGGACLVNPLGGNTVPQIIGRIVSWFGAAAGALFLLFLLWGGVEWMSARGDQAQAQRARQRIVASVAGIVVVLFSYMLVSGIIGVLPQ